MLGLATLMRSAWRPHTHVPATVAVVPGNFGTTGSLADYRRRASYTIIAPPEPRLRPFNGLIPVVWRLRDVDAAKIAAVEANAPKSFGAPVQFTPPRTASLITGGRAPR